MERAVTVVYEWRCPVHGGIAHSPPEGGELLFDKPCDCGTSSETWRAIEVTKIVDGVRHETRTVAEIEGAQS